MFCTGNIVRDKEDESTKLIVVEVQDIECGDFVIKQGKYSDQTVYDFNSRYEYVSEEDTVVTAVYYNQVQQYAYSRGLEKEIEDIDASQRVDFIQKVIERDKANKYHFPKSRLEKIPQYLELHMVYESFYDEDDHTLIPAGTYSDQDRAEDKAKALRDEWEESESEFDRHELSISTIRLNKEEIDN